MNRRQSYRDEKKYRFWKCHCGHVIDGVMTFKTMFGQEGVHLIRECPLIPKENKKLFREILARDFYGEFDSKERGTP
jgi:hypothetical protein